MSKPIIIGIAGGTSSGKTLVAKRLSEAFDKKEHVIIIKQDDYYKDQSDMLMEDRIKVNYDHPFAFDNDLMFEQLQKLVNGQAITKPIYDYTMHTRSKDYEIVNPCDVIVIEGLFALENEAIRDLMDIKIFVDTPADIRFIRRLSRDTAKRGRTVDSVIAQYTTSVRPMHEQFIEPSKKFADIIIPEGGKNDVAVDLIITKITSALTNKMEEKNV